jgi:hypothetical protein
LYNNTTLESTKFAYRIVLLTAIIAVIGMLLLAMQIPARQSVMPLTPWRAISIEDTIAQPLARPAMLSDAVIWRPLGDSALVYSHLSGSPQFRHDWLRGIPSQWQAWASSEAIHLVWLDIFGQLWSALLTSEGEQITAPIEIATDEVAQFDIVPLRGERLGVFWRADDTLRARIISTDGRPLSTQFLQNGISTFAITGVSGEIYLTWREANLIMAAEITLSDDLTLVPDANQRQITQLDLAPDAWLSSLDILLAEGFPVVMWGVTQSAAPDRASYEGLVLTNPEESSGNPFSLTLPDADGLRWASIDRNQIALAARIEGNWQPVVVEMSSQGPQGFQVIDGPPVTGSPIGFLGDHFAWVTVDTQGQPEIYATTLDANFGALALPDDVLTWREAIHRGLRASPRLIFWLMAPIFVLIYRRHWWYALPLATGFYWAGKLLIQFGLFTQYPTALDGIGVRSGFLTASLALLGIQSVALTVGFVGWGRTPALIRYFTYFLTDAVLTYAIFSASVE